MARLASQNVTVRVTFDKTKKIVDAMRLIANTRVMAGIPAEKGLREPEERESQPLNNAEIMYIHEFGDAASHIPPRPVIYPAMKAIRKDVIWLMGRILKRGMSGDISWVDRGFHALGIMAQNALRKRISDGPFVPLSPRTLAARRAKGRTGDKPLIDTGQLRRALTYVIRKIIGR